MTVPAAVDVSGNLARIRARMQRACERAGRAPQDVQLLGVAKTKPGELVARAAEAGLLDIGENYVQELLAKQAQLLQPIRWHFIGRLQSNKIRQIVGRTHLIHSVDRAKLLDEIEKRAAAADCRVACLLEVNVGEESSKGGVVERDVRELVRRALDAPHIELRGLMSIPPFLSDPEALRPYHRRLAELARRLRDETGMALAELSMGMSKDMEVAIEEGATIVRVGTDLFGPRNT